MENAKAANEAIGAFTRAERVVFLLHDPNTNRLEAALTRLQQGGLAERRTDARGAETLALTDRGRRLGDAVTAELLA